ncbi:MAG: acetylglutamate kinase [Candidatus Latescibacterota bacterium]|nr:acetylglutamate kinase [Candidatus Latescibacterota bacterium]
MEKIIEKAATLVEALPYIRSFRDKIVVVKYGGSTLPDEGGSETVLADLVFMETVGMQPVVIHGGGKEISRRLEEEGVQSHWVNGLRVTDAETMRVVEETLFRIVNRRISEGIEQLGGSARGMSAKDAEIMRVTQHFAETEVGGETKSVDICFVGDVDYIDPEPIRQVCEGEMIPVITPIGLGEDGKSYNVNADTAAGEIARALQAEKLVFLTDVNGICRDASDPSSRISTLHLADIEGLIDDGTIRGGMIPKVRAGERSVNGGVNKTHIIDGRLPHSQLLEIFTREGIGTEIVQ